MKEKRTLNKIFGSGARLDKIRKELNIKFINNDNLMLSIDNKISTAKNGN